MVFENVIFRIMLKKYLQVRGHKIFVLITGIICSFLFIHQGMVVYATDLTDPSRSIYDTISIEATVLIVHSDKAADIKINKIFKYTRHSQAEYSPLAIGEEIRVNFLWGTYKRVLDYSPLGPSTNDTILPGVKSGDILLAQIDGCSPVKNCAVADLGVGYFIHGYSLYSPIQQNNIKTPYEVYTLLINGKRIDSDVRIDLTSDGQNYSVTGYKKVKLLFAIPVHYKIELVVDHVTGQVTSFKKPWWVFLTK